MYSAIDFSIGNLVVMYCVDVVLFVQPIHQLAHLAVVHYNAFVGQVQELEPKIASSECLIDNGRLSCWST
tara:strand:+ start:271 stop:480 length:210 start_codon:yes stop_codon:yes gene_type:complete